MLSQSPSSPASSPAPGLASNEVRVNIASAPAEVKNTDLARPSLPFLLALWQFKIDASNSIIANIYHLKNDVLQLLSAPPPDQRDAQSGLIANIENKLALIYNDANNDLEVSKLAFELHLQLVRLFPIQNNKNPETNLYLSPISQEDISEEDRFNSEKVIPFIYTRVLLFKDEVVDFYSRPTGYTEDGSPRHPTMREPLGPREAQYLSEKYRISLELPNGSVRRLDRHHELENILKDVLLRDLLLFCLFGLFIPLLTTYIFVSPTPLLLICYLSIGAGLSNLCNNNLDGEMILRCTSACFVGSIIITGIVAFIFPPLLGCLAAHHLIPAIGAAAVPALRLVLGTLTPIVLICTATLRDIWLGPGHLYSFYESIYLKPLTLCGSALGFLGKGLKTIGMAIADCFGLNPAPTPPVEVNQPLRRSSSGRILAIEPPSGRRAVVMDRVDAEAADEDLEESPSPSPSPSAYWDRRPAHWERRSENDYDIGLAMLSGFDGFGHF